MNQTLPIGTVLHNGRYQYRIEEVLGKGGFGITYRVSASIMVGNVPQIVSFAVKEFFDDDVCDRNAANHTTLECLPSKRDEVNKYVDDFLTEARRLSDLSGKSQHIVRVNESFRENETAYYVMEYLDGGNLQQLVLGQPKKRMAGRGPLSEREAISYLLPIMDAVDLLHQEHILHLDIKPDNIMLMRDPIHGTIHPVLIDFGVTKHFDKEGRPTTKSRAKGGTVGYAPLEQFFGISNFMPEIDVYALGATLLFLLTGKNPPDATLLEDRNLPDLIPAGVSKPVRQAIIGSMQKLRENRLPTVAAMLNVLGQQQALTPVEPIKPSGSGRVTKPLRDKNESVGTKPLRETGTPFFKQYGSRIVMMVVVLAVLIGGITWFSHGGEVNHEDDDLKDTERTDMSSQSETSSSDETEEVSQQTENSDLILNNLVSNMVPVEGGTFRMGANPGDSEAFADEKLRHQVTLSGFSIGRYEVTREEWEAVMGSNPSNIKGKKRPVEQVSWNDSQEFIRKLNAKTGKQFRLPTEAEWEYAARGGNKSQGYLYSGSNNIDDVAWYDDNQTHDVGQKSPNELGLYDMSGNVWEWCQDWYDVYFYSSSSQTNPTGPASGSRRVIRGGSWFGNTRGCRVSFRGGNTPDYRDDYLGFRLVL